MADWQKVINFALMISIIDHIEYLTRRHNCVVIPHWGALIAQYRPSHVDATGGKLSKPKREFGFNASIDHNDGLLANSIVRRHGLSYDEATRLIADSVSLYKRQLQSGYEVPFGKIGYFMLNENGQTEFMPFVHGLTNDEYFGLQSFTFKPLATTSTVSTHEEQPQEPAKVIPFTQRNKFAYRALQVAASIAIILGIVFVASTPIAVDRSQQNYATLNMPTVKKAATQDMLIQQETGEKTSEALSDVSKPDDNQVANHEETGKYFLVISTFTSEQKAREYIQLHPDIRDVAKIRAKGKQFRVYIQRGDDYRALYQAAVNLPSQYGSGWVTTD